jgi:hypothetical protein
MEYNDTNFNILLHLSYNDILQLCQVNKNINNICLDAHFWKVKYFKDFYSTTMTKASWRETYEYTFLLNLDYNQLINVKNNNITNDNFWHDKYDKDFVFGD